MGLFGDMDLKKDQILDCPLCQVKITNHLVLDALEQFYTRQNWRILTCSAAKTRMLLSPELDANGWYEATSRPLVTHGQGSAGILL